MAKVRRQGGSTPNYTETGLAEWFSRLDVSQGKPVPLLDDDNVASPTTSTRTPLSDLKPIRLAEMDKTKKYSGRYLLCRARGMPILRYGIAFPAEDQDGQLFIAYLRNYPLHGFKQDDLRKLFPPGTVFLIREPAFTVSTTKGMPSDVHVSSPTSVEVYKGDSVALAGLEWASVSPYRPPEPGYDPYAAGQALLDAKQPYFAVQAFTEALARAETQQRTVLVTLGRARAHLRAGQPAAAYHDTSIVLMYSDMGVDMSLDQRYTVMSLRADALTALGLHDRAESVVDDLIALLDDTATSITKDLDQTLTARVSSSDPPSEDVVSAQTCLGVKVHQFLLDARSRQYQDRACKEQSESGVYNFISFELAADPPLKPPCHRLNCRNHLGPIRVAQLKRRNGGRGVIATRDIKPGELLLVEKAFAVAEFPTTPTAAFDAWADQVSHRPQDTLAVEVAARVVDDPSTLPILESLFDGRDPPKHPLVFDALSQRSVPEYASPPIDLDMEWLERICATNGFNYMPADLYEHDPSNSGPSRWSALFLNGSAFNHSCLPNTYHKSVGDLLVVRSRVFIKKGKEVYVSYAPIDVTQALSRWCVLDRHFAGDGCPCAYCVETNKDDEEELEQRRELLEDFDGLFCDIIDSGERSAQMCAERYAELSGMVADVRGTFTGKCDVKPELVEPYARLVEIASGDVRSAATVLRGPMAEAWSSACEVAGAWPNMSGDVWELDPAPLCWPEHVVKATLDYARACDAESSAAAQAHALGLLTLAANQARIEDGDDVEQFWQRWSEELVGLEQHKERLVERMSKRRRK